MQDEPKGVHAEGAVKINLFSEVAMKKHSIMQAENASCLSYRADGRRIRHGSNRHRE
jgi:hypothetical protein